MLKGVTLKWRITNYDSVKNCNLKINKSGLNLS